MATVDELARDVIASIATDANAIAAARWIDNRYKEMVARVKFRHLRQVGELYIPGVFDTGTLSVTRGSTAITGDSTQFDTDVTVAGGVEYCVIRPSSAWYKITSVGSETAITLTSNFAEDDISDGSYKLVKRYHPLDSNARWVGDFYFTRLRRTLADISLNELDILFPGRTLAGHIPSHVAQVGVDSNNYLMYEIYPPPVNSELINYIYWNLPTALTISSTIPPVIDSYMLKEGVLIDLYRYEKAAAIRKGNIEQAAIWRNDEKAQATIWDKVMKDAIRTSRGSDDITLILEMFRGVPFGRGEQRTAREYVYDNWSR